MVREVRVPEQHDGQIIRAEARAPGAYTSPSNGKARSDGGHIAHNRQGRSPTSLSAP